MLSNGAFLLAILLYYDTVFNLFYRNTHNLPILFLTESSESLLPSDIDLVSLY